MTHGLQDGQRLKEKLRKGGVVKDIERVCLVVYNIHV